MQIAYKDKVRPTAEALSEGVFGRIDPGEGWVVSLAAPMPGCVIVRFTGSERMVHQDWLDVEPNPFASLRG